MLLLLLLLFALMDCVENLTKTNVEYCVIYLCVVEVVEIQKYMARFIDRKEDKQGSIKPIKSVKEKI